MQLNLRKARKLEAKIAKHIETTELSTEVAVRAKASLADALAARTAASTKLVSDLDVLNQLNELRYSIRSQIANANQGVGINALMTQREQLKSKVKILQKLATAQVAVSEEELQDVLETTAKALEKGDTRGYGMRTDVKVNTSSVLEDSRKAINAEIQATVKGLEDVEDELAQKNLGAKVNLSDEQVMLLKASALI
jgi:hypothetical protein